MSEHYDPEAGTAAVVADLVKDLHKVEIINVVHPYQALGSPFAAVPKSGGGFELVSVKNYIDEFREHPERRAGTAIMRDLESFIAHVNRFKNDDTAIFADPTRESPGLLAVIDYHDQVNLITKAPAGDNVEIATNEKAKPRFCRHKTEYRFPLSDEYKAWIKSNGMKMSQAQFAAFVEDRILDIMAPPLLTGNLSDADAKLKEMMDLLGGRLATPQRMMELSRGLAVYESSRAVSATNLASGEGSIVFQTEHQDEQGQALEVPTMFLIGVPVFLNGPAYRIPVRLRYRKEGQAINWHYELYRHDKVFDHAFTEGCAKTAAETGRPLFVGFPEKN